MLDGELLGDRAATGTPVSPAIHIDSADAQHWDADCDVLVIGIGLAGACAALAAAETEGVRVVAIDRFEGGGASELSGGIIYAGGTHVQRELGIEDSADNLFAYLGHETGTVVAEDTLRRFCEGSAGDIEWLERYGVRFGGPLYPKKTSYPPSSYNLYFSGNENVPECKARATPAPRGHRAMETFRSKAVFGGVYLMGELKRAMDRAANIRFWRQATARQLILGPDNEVLGVEIWRLPSGLAAWRHRFLNRYGRNVMATALGLTRKFWTGMAAIEQRHARPQRIRVRKGVILSGGGFIYNPAMMRRVAPAYLGKVTPLGTIGDDGSAIQLGVSAGAGLANMGTISAWRFINPPYDWCKGIVLSPDGATRLTNEEQYGARMGHAMFEKAGGHGLLIVDETLMNGAKAELEGGLLHPHQKYPTISRIKLATTAPTIEQLDARLGLDGRLARQVALHNAAIASGEPDAFGKSAEMRHALIDGPFYAIDISDARTAPMTAITVGGLTVDESNGQVLDGQGAAITGLYAAGRTANSLVSHFYVSGLSLADCVFSGRRAGAAAAEQVPG